MSRFPNLTIDTYYTALAWAGLSKDMSGQSVTRAWEEFQKNNPDLALMYLTIMAAEDNGTELAASKEKCQ